jgi:hypothetical protein
LVSSWEVIDRELLYLKHENLIYYQN